MAAAAEGAGAAARAYRAIGCWKLNAVPCCNPTCSYCCLARATPGPAAKPGATGTAPASTHIVQRLASLVASAGCTEKAIAVTFKALDLPPAPAVDGHVYPERIRRSRPSF